jgi:hypothetical protein
MTKPSSCSLFPVTWSLFAAAMPSREQASRPTKRWLRRNGTSRVPYKNIASFMPQLGVMAQPDDIVAENQELLRL